MPPVNRELLLQKREALFRADPMFGAGARMFGLGYAEMDKMVLYSVPLREVIDVEQLVNAQALREDGIEPGAVRVAMGVESEGAFSHPPLHAIVVTRRDLARPDEDIYMLFAHELVHHQQMLGEARSEEEMRAEERRAMFHAERQHEVEAIRVEIAQAERFGWTPERYDEFLLRMYPENFRADIPPWVREEAMFRQREERRLRRAIGVPSVHRREVPVRRHARRVRPRV